MGSRVSVWLRSSRSAFSPVSLLPLHVSCVDLRLVVSGCACPSRGSSFSVGITGPGGAGRRQIPP